jgi:hypothetical protein
MKLHAQGLRHDVFLADALLVLLLLSIIEGRHKDSTCILEELPHYMHSDTTTLLFDFTVRQCHGTGASLDALLNVVVRVVVGGDTDGCQSARSRNHLGHYR